MFRMGLIGLGFVSSLILVITGILGLHDYLLFYLTAFTMDRSTLFVSERHLWTIGGSTMIMLLGYLVLLASSVGLLLYLRRLKETPDA